MKTSTGRAMKGGAIAPTKQNDQRSPVDEPGAFQARTSPPWDQKGADIAGLIQPMLEALAKLADLDSTYLTVFDWERREQEVRFVFSAGTSQIVEGHRIPLPAEVSQEIFAGVTSSQGIGQPQPDGLIARGLGLKTFVSVPVTVAKHRLFGMLCGASRDPRELSETVVGMFESFAGIMAEHLVQVQIDETEERAVAAESRLLTRARFLAEAEHRMKTPLTVLQGTSLTLRDQRQTLSEPERLELDQSMVRNVLLLSQELESLLIEARADVRARELVPVDTDLGALAREIAGAFDGLSAAHHVVAEVPHPVIALIDPDAVCQVLGHLIDNAIKYSPSGGLVTIRVSKAAGLVSIDVIDEGPGLPPEVDVFGPFRRGHSQDQRTPGIGLGLHIVRNLVEAMEGTVTARSNPETGSTFAVTLPAATRRRGRREPADRPDAIITLAYYDADGRVVDSEQLQISPDPGSVWIRPSAQIMSWPTVRTVRASLARTPITPVDIDVYLLEPASELPAGSVMHPDLF